MTSRWLRLLRIHTSSLTQPVVLLGLVLAGVKVGWMYPVFALFAVIYHAAGFIQNDIYDHRQDQSDPAKKHFPLVTGEISIKQARLLYIILTLLLLLGGLKLSNGRPAAILALIGAVLFGILYNVRSKTDLFSPLYIAAAFVILPVFSFYSYARHLNSLTLAVIGYLFFLMLFQIGVEGYMKDLSADRVSLLHRLGTQTLPDGTLHVSTATRWFAWMLRLPALILMVIIASLAGTSPLGLILACLFMLGNGWATVRLLRGGRYNQHKRVRFCAIIEVFTYSQLICALQGLLGWTGTAVFILYPYIWFLILNQLTWKTWITPRV